MDVDADERVRREVEAARARLDAFFGGFSVSSNRVLECTPRLVLILPYPQRSITPLESDKASQQTFDFDGSPPSSTTQKRISDAVSEAQSKAATAKAAAQKPRKPKVRTSRPRNCTGVTDQNTQTELQPLPIDRNIEMDGDKIRDMRQTYAARMRVEREKTEHAKKERAAHERAVNLIFGVPEICKCESDVRQCRVTACSHPL